MQFFHMLGYISLHIWIRVSQPDAQCDDSDVVIVYTLFWYIVYLVMFANFFKKQYIGPLPEKKFL
jgi:hypothetical protein